MRVKCVRIVNKITGEEQAGRSDWLSVGSEYVVLSVEASPGRQISLQLIGDDGKTPAFYDSDQFVTVSEDLPSNWKACISSNGTLSIAPASWLRLGFWEDYFNDQPQAVAEYEAELAITTAEAAKGQQ